jgi:hypothetical protein
MAVELSNEVTEYIALALGLAGLVFIVLLFAGRVRLEDYSWYRRRIGGHWEQWFVDGVNTYVWFQCKQCYHWGGGRPPLAYGSPRCEDYGEIK